MFYLCLMAAGRGEESETYPLPDWAAMTEDAQNTLLQEWSQVIGMHCAGVYEAATPEAALELAMADAWQWAGGCVA